MQKSSGHDPIKIDAKWQMRWLKSGIYSPDIKKSSRPFYNLWMFPYPSAEGLHAGHAFASTGSDIYGRFMRMSGHDVFQPIGYDSFGIHSENFALKIGEQPQNMLERTTKNYERQLKSLGHGYDWTRTVTTSNIDYYRWTQWLFVELFKAGLAYRAEHSVNWCPSCKTVLADEQVINGRCERCDSIVEKKELEQWFLRITEYAERLLGNLKKIDWTQKIKVAQENWIGKSEGMEIDFEVYDSKLKIPVFTTRPDTLNGATFLVLSSDSKWVQKVTSKEQRGKVSEYIKSTQMKGEGERMTDKNGVFTGAYAINPLTGGKIPIWVADYVLSGYGTGAIMGVPFWDERDREFAEKHEIEIVKKEPDIKLWQRIEEKGWGKKRINYHLRDWLISRQRYWGPPIPMIYCASCAKEGKSYFDRQKPTLRQDQGDWDPSGWYPEENLPVELPVIEDYRPRGTGRGPLSIHPEFYEVTCPGCGAKATRETDVSDTFLDSSWYFLRYPSVGGKTQDKEAFDPEITHKWLPVHFYFGGAEHALLHLMYSRFMTMFLFDIGKVGFEEPFPRFFAHGLMIKDGAKMSKSRGNVVNPDQYIEKYGADSFRLYLMFIGPMDGSPDFRDTGMEGMKRFTERVWKLYEEHLDTVLEEKKDARDVLQRMHQTIKKVTKDIQNFRYNVAISSIMEFVNLLEEKTQEMGKKRGKIRCAEWDEALVNLALILSPFTPHMTEEIWVERLGKKFSIHNSPWPKFDPELAKEDQITVVVQVNGKLRAQLEVSSSEGEDRGLIEKLAVSEPRVERWIKGEKLKKVVFVSGKLINFVT